MVDLNSTSSISADNITAGMPELPGQAKIIQRPNWFTRSFCLDMAWAWLALVACLGLTIMAYVAVDSASYKAADDKFKSRVFEISEAIEWRFAAYAQTLNGGLGLFRAAEPVSREAWRIYVETLDIERLFPGIQGIGFAEWVTPQRRAEYEENVRDEGFPDFQIRPPGSRELYSSNTYLEPLDMRNRQAFGYDMYAQETRRVAMDRARDTGIPTISGKVRLVQEINEDVQAGFLMYVPYYGPAGTPNSVAARRAASVGFVHGAFRMRNLMDGILGRGIPDLRLRIFDGAETADDALMYDSDPTSDYARPIFQSDVALPIGQHVWTLEITSLPAIEEYLDPQKSAFILAGGILTSVLFFFVIGSYASTRRRAEVLAAKMTSAIEQHAAELTRSNEELGRFAYVASHDLKAPLRGIDHLASWITEDLGDKLSGESKEHMTMLRGRIKRLEALLDDLLIYSRAGSGEISVEQVSLNGLILETFDLLNVEKRFELTYKSDIDQIAVRRTELEQVITNIFSNAIKYHDGDWGHLYVTVQPVGDMIDFVIEDDGPGIPEEHREKVFEMFKRLQPRDEIEGSGMGLSILRKIVQRNGGDVRVVGRDNGERGASFRFNWKAEVREDADTDCEGLRVSGRGN